MFKCTKPHDNKSWQVKNANINEHETIPDGRTTTVRKNRIGYIKMYLH